LKLYSYVIARDYGFAPNPFYGFCTLATCKPRIRHAAAVGDWIVGTGSKKYDLHGHLVYAMRVTEASTFEEYWRDPRFAHKRPNLCGSLKQWFGDNIYHHNPRSRRWMQENSHHSRDTGRPLQNNIDHDTQTDRVLISDDFVYFGGSAPRIPAPFRRSGHELWKNGAGHKSNFAEAYVERVVEWLGSLGSWGCAGDPAAFAKLEWE
jgi:putative DNA base modification enzyme with NMAD domain